ncbi:MAG: chromosome segregation protein SMC [Parasporobacterium sp.]|nr:chromosome segregation protein SMC [Parasporobacterium sp.]
MYLKSIEIHGFKSFANKIIFEFPEGITGIVGPNGSGKSNVADAVRWVLGEQKIKQLRGSKMEDVIFAGTSTRRPQSYAFVAITLDNSDHKLKVDFNEVTISRRVYRSGESEYMINGSVCRLRDVQEMFYDTGIGKEGYSIIGQGQIDKILQGKPEERREIFDEAVGIVKFKKRKTLALRKLENERQNLARVSDILNELKRQVGPLKRQSEAAEQFVVYKNDLKKYDINLFLFENGDIRTRIRDTQRKEEITRKELEAAAAEFEETRKEYQRLSEELTLMEEKISRVRTEISRSNIIRENLKGRINVLSEQIRSAGEAESTYLERVESLQEQIDASRREKEQLLTDKEETQKKLSKAVTDSGRKDSLVLDIQEKGEHLRQQIESRKEQLIELVAEKGRLNARMERLNTRMEEMKRRREELSANLQKFSSDKADREQETKTLQEALEEAAGQVREAEEKVQEQLKAQKEAEERIRTLERELSLTREKRMKGQAALESLRNITERYEGYGNTIREIMKLKDKTPGIHGVVADIIRTEKKYETAIETALGGSIQNVVTDTEATAKEVIEYLKKNKLGRATFLPLKAVTGRGEFRQSEALEEEGVLGLASSLVQVEDRYKGVAEYLLGKIVVADTIDHALVIARKYKYSLIIVTLEGELLNRGGSLTGGAFKNKSNLLGRRREMEDLEKMIRQASQQEKEISHSLEEAVSGRRDLTSAIELLRSELSEHRIYHNTVQVNLQAAIRREEELEGRVKDADQESRSIEEQTGTITDENSSIHEMLEENEQQNDSVKEEILRLETELEENKELESREMLLAQTMKVETSRISEQINFLSESAARSDQVISRLQSELEELNTSHENLDSVIIGKQKEIEEIRVSITRADEEIALQETSLADLEKQKEENSLTHKDFIEQREAFAQRTTNLDKELFRLTSLREKLEERFESKSNYIWEEYQLTYNNALDLRDEELQDAKVMRERIAELKSSIRSLGTINVGAIEEYKEVRERYEFLSSQHEDLVKAEKDLVRIIRDLDREMRSQFNTEFRKIRSEFSRVFKEMFGGGFGTIELEEDVDVLEAGITVIAQPPGKKLQNMMQLSGGEKALTAIALLFAIQNLKPSPFCILDEIEAALDDSNIIRYANYLHKLTKDTQFIVITHRKGTMEAADRLYGITMQERGVSTLISVNLADVEDETEQVG